MKPHNLNGSFLVAAVAVMALGSPAQAAIISHGTTTINMEFVTVGNTDNTGDTQTQGTFGAVDYVFRIGKYEVSKNQWLPVVAADGSDLLDDLGSWNGDQPVGDVTWHEAAMFCNWLTSGNVMHGAYPFDASGHFFGTDRASAVSTYGTVYVIPTENEWYKAAYYDPSKGGPGVPGYWDYPTKHDDPSVPEGISSDVDTAFDAVFSDGYNQEHPNDVDNAGVLSAYGTMGQGGNLWEWNEITLNVVQHGLRGGCWLGPTSTLHAANRPVLAPDLQEQLYFGFRVASIEAAPEPPDPNVVPEPTTLIIWSLLGACGMAGGWYRRQKAAPTLQEGPGGPRRASGGSRAVQGNARP